MERRSRDTQALTNPVESSVEIKEEPEENLIAGEWNFQRLAVSESCFEFRMIGWFCFLIPEQSILLTKNNSYSGV